MSVKGLENTLARDCYRTLRKRTTSGSRRHGSVGVPQIKAMGACQCGQSKVAQLLRQQLFRYRQMAGKMSVDAPRGLAAHHLQPESGISQTLAICPF
jgi:hypothetical protein